MKENLYLLYSHYGINESDSSSRIIVKAAKKSYMDFCRRVFFQDRVPIEKRSIFEREVAELLSAAIPDLLDAVGCESGSQELFDKKHKEICEAIIHVFDNAGGQTYGIAQRWLNLTLMNMVVIESNLQTGYFPITDTRKYFHVPVDQYLLEAATRRKGRFQHGLSLKCAPLIHDIPDCYQMDQYRHGKMQPFEYWEYPEYMEFQLAVRNELQENLTTNQVKLYQDSLDWAFSAYMEVSQARIKY